MRHVKRLYSELKTVTTAPTGNIPISLDFLKPALSGDNRLVSLKLQVKATGTTDAQNGNCRADALLAYPTITMTDAMGPCVDPMTGLELFYLHAIDNPHAFTCLDLGEDFDGDVTYFIPIPIARLVRSTGNFKVPIRNIAAGNFNVSIASLTSGPAAGNRFVATAFSLRLFAEYVEAQGEGWERLCVRSTSMSSNDYVYAISGALRFAGAFLGQGAALAVNPGSWGAAGAQEITSNTLGLAGAIDTELRDDYFRIVQPQQSEVDRKSTRLNSSHIQKSRMPSSA